MSSNVGLSTPRGSGTSGYVQRNSAFLKPRAAGFGAPYPPVSSNGDRPGSGFKQRQPDKQILEHDRRRAIEVTVLEERERLEEENEELEEKKQAPLTEEEIDEKCEGLRQKLIKEMEEGGADGGAEGGRRGDRRRAKPDSGPRERRQFKSYQVHEQAEAKMQESERLRKALGIKEDWERPSSSETKDKQDRPRDGDRERRDRAPDSDRYRS